MLKIEWLLRPDYHVILVAYTNFSSSDTN